MRIALGKAAMPMGAPRVYGYAALSGVLLGVASLPGPLGPLAFAGLIPLLRALEGCSPGRAARAGWLAGVPYYGLAFGWVLTADLPSRGAFAAAFAVSLALIAGLLGAFALAVAWLGARSWPLALAAAPGLWIATEFLRAQEWTVGLSQCCLGDGLADWPALGQLAGFGGRYALAFWVVSVNAAVLLLPRVPPRLGWVLAATLLAPISLGALALFRHPEPARSFRVAAVQPSLSEPERHRPDRVVPNLAVLLALSEQALAQPADLVAWPESAFDRNVAASGDAFLAALGGHLGVPLVTGAWLTSGAGNGAWWNGAVLSDAGTTRWVSQKVHPFPIYERAPEGPIARWLARIGFWRGRFAPGAQPQPVLLPARLAADAVPVGFVLCVDAFYPEVSRTLRAEGARLLVTLANEAGAGQWAAGLNARAARLRAIENGVPVVRVANTGPSLWIDAHGRIVASLAARRAESAAADLALAGPLTLYTRLGDAPLFAGLFGTALAAVGFACVGGGAATRPVLDRSSSATLEGVST